MVPKHPTDERSAAWFHGVMCAVGVVHVIGGVIMVYWHGVGARRHWKDAAEEAATARSHADEARINRESGV